MSGVEEIYLSLRSVRRDAAFACETNRLLRNFFSEGKFGEGWFAPAQPRSYTRRKLVGEEDLSIWAIEWAPGFFSLPHEHHRELCSPLVLEGKLSIMDVIAEPVGSDRYRVRPFPDIETAEYDAFAGTVATVNPETDMHAVAVREKSRSIHVYGANPGFAWCYLPLSATGEEIDDPHVAHYMLRQEYPWQWVRRQFELRED